MRLVNVFVFLSFVTIGFCDNSVEGVTTQWLEIQSRLEELIAKQSKNAFRLLLPLVLELNLDAACMSSLNRMQNGMRNLEKQYIKLLDASGKLASGVIGGTMTDFGNFQQCMDSVVYKDDGDFFFRGQYCLADLRLPLPEKPKALLATGEGVIDPSRFRKGSMLEHFANESSVLYWLSFRHGICVPSTCSEKDVNNVYKKLAEKAMLNGTVFACQEKEKETEFNSAQWITSIGLALVALPTLTVTFVNFTFGAVHRRAPRIFEPFQRLSVDYSLRKIWGSQNDGSLGFIHGLRVLSILWLILSHSYAYLNWNSMANAVNVQESLKGWAFQPISNGWLVVDSFYCVSGFLLTYNTATATRSILSLFLKFILRYWRIIPLAFAVFSYQFLFELFFKGPLMPLLNDPMTKNCAKKWWHLLLLIYELEDESSCLPHFWYVTVDLILFGIQLILSTIIWWKPTLGIAGHVSAIAYSMYSVARISIRDELPPIIPLGQDRELAIEVAQKVYFHWATHLASYVVGSLAAYTATRRKGTTRRPMTLIVQLLCWLFALSAGTVALFSARFWVVSKPSSDWGVLYASSQRFLWSALVGWVMFACSAGYARFLNRILSLRQWIPLSRISYAVYLCHAYVLYANTRAATERKEASHYSIWRDACAVLVYSSFLALVTSVFIEAPIVAIQKICTPRERKSEGRKRQQTHQEVHEQREQDPVQLQFQEKMTRTVAEDAELTEITTCSPAPPEYDASYL